MLSKLEMHHQNLLYWEKGNPLTDYVTVWLNKRLIETIKNGASTIIRTKIIKNIIWSYAK